ncbi:MAG: glycerol kinase GlpK [Pseudomonadota bacterium]
MPAKNNILAIDQGTTSSRAILFDRDSNLLRVAQKEFAQHYPKDGWVEHDPEDIWRTTLETAKEAISMNADETAAIGITNQRETTVIWDRETGAPIYNAIVWQDRRTADLCDSLRAKGLESEITERTGLLLDPYFSASKVAWILDNVDGARARAEAGELAFGTIDCFLIWRLTGGKMHATDATNASRTSLFNIHKNDWDPRLLEIFRVPAGLLPEVKNCADDFGESDARHFGKSIPIAGVAGDQQAASIGQAGFSEGAIKSTYGTGCFLLTHTGADAARSTNKLLTTIAYRIGGETAYALEGSIFVAGAAVQWLRDELGLFESASETEALAASLDSNHGVYLVPAFTGLGAPHWRPDARGAIVGLTRGVGKAAFARAALESVAYQTHDLMKAISADGVEAGVLRVDGGMVANNWLMQFLADILQTPVERPVVMETTALGAAYLAGLQIGIYRGTEEISKMWRRDAKFDPAMSVSKRDQLLRGWRDALARTLAD